MYKILLMPSAGKDLDNLEQRIFLQVNKRLSELASNPRPQGCQKLTNEEGYRFRSGDYRILYRIDDSSKAVYIYRIKHRKNAYR
ncbi:MAG: type II toxin-antitoxin system RelE/ParE family toxin [Candidatus Omnitrophica bacterium]|nr:type II toxin-antitoxin system RelE/ParE family toxin [Candidatus Omnitrophota bacterium]